MSVPAAYIAVVLVWSTTPLGIVWSTEVFHPTFAVFLRMAIALVIGWIVVKLWSIKMPWDRAARKLYFFSAIGIVGGMLLSYLAAAYISSGLMSLIFGLSPILSGLLAQKILAEPKFSMAQKIALALAVTGLGIVSFDNFNLYQNGWIGIVLVLIAVSLFSLSGVLVKSVQIQINPIASTLGTLSFATPVFGIVWLLSDGQIPTFQIETRGFWAVIYLGVLGSFFAFIAYYYILQKLKASTVALVTLITPAFALYWGSLLNNEAISHSLINGAACIIIGLGIYLFGDKIYMMSLAKKPDQNNQIE
ncbi:DMT family transporter [Algibacillus agarilyticus]|uniref:DMT family transporter n=1 Tax=Algibacillus agarilyticus TaxID=2234133 RepID=UPI000DCFB301|nr:DMT family transporter [Algibacillus agarilyticus]